MRIALCLLLGIDMQMSAQTCFGCSGNRPLDMYHALSCKMYGGLIYRHDKVKVVISDICRYGQLFYQLEPRHVFGQGKIRPDLLIHFGQDGHDVAYDLTVVNPVRDVSAVNCTLRHDQKFLEIEEKVKVDKYADLCAKNGATICPIVLSAFGGILRNSYSTGLSPLIHKIRKNHFCSPNWAAPNRTTYWLQRIAIALWVGNVAKVKPFLHPEWTIQH